MATLVSSITYPGSNEEYIFRAQKLPAAQVGGTDTPVYVKGTGEVSAVTSVSTALLPTIPASKLPTLYWANVTVSSATSSTTQPVVSTVTVQANSTSKCKMQYDSTESCLKFVFN